MKNILHGSLVSAIFTLALVCPPVRAAIVVTTDYRDSAPAYAVAQDDLFQTHLKGLELEGDLFDRHMDINELVDGQFGDLGAGSTAGTAAVAAGGVLIFVLNLDESPEGYDLTALRSFAGWDSSGDGQEYTVEYATVDTPKDFQTLITVGPFNPGYTNNNSSTRVTLTDSEGMLMHRAAVIRITFTAFENGATYYREFDAIGAPASAATAQVPQLLNYQGRVVVGSSNFNGTGQFKFSLVDGGGKMTYWSNDGSGLGGEPPDTAVALPVVNGLYSVLLGDTALGNMLGIPAQVFTHADVRLRVWFNDGVNDFQLLSPDQRIAAVGYAMVA
ncbi:MAG: hypothetical protein KA257_00955, partial [Opitutaceae bacterium]|nr:hypothetical protein [Opitutaceae bacterium]